MKAVLFDFDGVLVNSEPLHYRALRGCLLPEGIDVGRRLRPFTRYDDQAIARRRAHGIRAEAARVQALAGLVGPVRRAVTRGAAVPARELVQSLARELRWPSPGALRSEIDARPSACARCSTRSWARKTWIAASPIPKPSPPWRTCNPAWRTCGRRVRGDRHDAGRPRWARA
jgi:beta-phosphoglucomutase-like phosphatase (HAD superfamily)